jgi:hypothetical protein
VNDEQKSKLRCAKNKSENRIKSNVLADHSSNNIAPYGDLFTLSRPNNKLTNLLNDDEAAHDVVSSMGCSDIVFDRPRTQGTDVFSSKSTTTAATRAKNPLNLKKYEVINKEQAKTVRDMKNL